MPAWTLPLSSDCNTMRERQRPTSFEALRGARGPPGGAGFSTGCSVRLDAYRPVMCLNPDVMSGGTIVGEKSETTFTY
eukprot:5018628-Prymnesium_polylepis.1